MADIKQDHRPLSPHLQIYRPQLTSITSILIRITGNALIVSAVLVVWWLVSAAFLGSNCFAIANTVITSWFGNIIFIASAWALWYHYLGGLRHLYFDTGRGLDILTAQKLGWGMIIGSVVLTVITVIIV